MALTAEQIAQYERMSQGKHGSGVDKYLRMAIPDGQREITFNVRILPTIATEGRMHYLKGPNKISATCPLQFKEEDKDVTCDVCDTFFANLQTFKASEHWNDFKTFGPKHRVYFNVLDPETKKVLVWSLPADGPDSFGNSILAGIVERSKKGIDVTDPDKGRNVSVTLTRRGSAFLYSGTWATKNSKLPKAAEGWEENLHDLEAIPKQRVLNKEEQDKAIQWFKDKVGIDN